MGTVTDATGAVIPGVSITAKNTATGFTYATQSNAEGIYRTPYVNPGMYELTFEVSGFKRLVRSNIQVRSTETVRVNASLEIGTLVESVEVTAASQLLETETSTTGHLVTGKSLTTLNTPQMKIQTILYLMPDVTSSEAGMGHVAGQRARAFNATMDGVSGMEPVRGSVSTNRFLATVQHNMAEMKILTTALPAEYGHSGGGVMNITYKSGTNELHGLAEERYVHKKMIHRAWDQPNERFGPFAFHLVSGTLSGPVRLPGYDGRNKTFWLLGFQRHHEKASEENVREVPSPGMFQGDFSYGLAGPCGGAVTSNCYDPIYDPASLSQLPDGTYTRTAFPNNRIPLNRFSQVANNFLALDPYRSERPRFGSDFVQSNGPQNNLSWDTTYRSYRTGFDYKIDHSFSDMHKIFGRFSNYRHRSFNGRWQVSFGNKIFDYRFTPIPIDQSQLVISDSITINPTTVNEIRLGFNRRKFSREPESLGQDWAGQLGIPNVGPETMPNFRRCSNLNCTGTAEMFGNDRFPEGREVDVTENFSIQENLTLVRGRHTFKVGYELLRTRANSLINAEPSGRYGFGGTELPFTPNTGHPFASFLLGGVRRAEFTFDLASWLPRWWTNSWYVQTDWKVTSQLTLNLGVRWQHETPFHTKYGQQSQFDPTAIDPLTGNVGALLHPDEPLASRDLNNFQPRVGLAYNFHPDWVFRAGFAINTMDLWTNGLRENFDEYRGLAVIQPEPGNPDIAFHIDQGPPDFQLNVTPEGFAPFVGTNFSGRSASFYDPNMRAPYVANWNGGFQWQLSDTMMLDFGYQGSAGVGLLNRWDINAVPLDISDDFDTLNTIRRSFQNFRPFPHFGTVNHFSNYGHNSYHGATIKFEKRYSAGFTLTSFYTRSKTIDEDSDDSAASGITFYNRALEKAASDYDIPNRWVTYSTWELPFGRGQRWMTNSPGWVNGLLGGWTFSAIQTLENGGPESFSFSGTGNVFLPGGRRPNLAPGATYDDIQTGNWDRKHPCRFDLTCAPLWARQDGVFAIPDSFTPGQTGRNIVYKPSLLWWQGSLSKEFTIRERVKFMVRGDVADIFKYPFLNFGNSNSATVNFRNPIRFGKLTDSRGGFSSLGGTLYWHLIFRLTF